MHPRQQALLFFAAYPIVTSIMWITTSMIFLRTWERGGPPPDSISDDGLPLATVLIPAHNEAEVIADTLRAACRIDYPHYEVVVVDDGSSDETARRVEAFLDSGRVRLVRKLVNEGKALALNDALPLVNGEIILTLDADAAPDPMILRRIVPHFKSARVAAVTGNPQASARTMRLRTALSSCRSLPTRRAYPPCRRNTRPRARCAWTGVHPVSSNRKSTHPSPLSGTGGHWLKLPTRG